jgi:flagellar motor protein MotB
MEHLAEGDSGIFGPGTDLVVSLAAVLILVLAIKSMLHSEDLERLRHLEEDLEARQQGELLLTEVLENQRRLAEEVAERFSTEATPFDEDVYVIDIDGHEPYDIAFHNHVDRQRITFGSHILFDPDAVDLTVAGRDVLMGFSDALGDRIDDIREIHIEGHADTSVTQTHDSNLDLAAKRAITVFRTFEESGIDPHEIVMSATSYGEYLSVQRFHASRISDESYSRTKVMRDNVSAEQKSLNRRIEVRLVYTLHSRGETAR